MRKINYIIVHCSATRVTQDVTVEDIDRMHRERGYVRGIGYHYYVCKDGKIYEGRPLEWNGAHCRGWNAVSLGVCYEGGLDAQGKPADTRTMAQKASMLSLLEVLKDRYPEAHIMGHRDTGAKKECPCFDAETEYQHLNKSTQ